MKKKKTYLLKTEQNRTEQNKAKVIAQVINKRPLAAGADTAFSIPLYLFLQSWR